MKIAFLSNYLNHHQIPFCQAINKIVKGNFKFISVESMAQEREKMGWAVDTEYDFEIKMFESTEKTEKQQKPDSREPQIAPPRGICQK